MKNTVNRVNHYLISFYAGMAGKYVTNPRDSTKSSKETKDKLSRHKDNKDNDLRASSSQSTSIVAVTSARSKLSSAAGNAAASPRKPPPPEWNDIYQRIHSFEGMCEFHRQFHNKPCLDEKFNAIDPVTQIDGRGRLVTSGSSEPIQNMVPYCFTSTRPPFEWKDIQVSLVEAHQYKNAIVTEIFLPSLKPKVDGDRWACYTLLLYEESAHIIKQMLDASRQFQTFWNPYFNESVPEDAYETLLPSVIIGFDEKGRRIEHRFPDRQAWHQLQDRLVQCQNRNLWEHLTTKCVFLHVLDRQCNRRVDGIKEIVSRLRDPVKFLQPEMRPSKSKGQRYYLPAKHALYLEEQQRQTASNTSLSKKPWRTFAVAAAAAASSVRSNGISFTKSSPKPFKPTEDLVDNMLDSDVDDGDQNPDPVDDNEGMDEHNHNHSHTKPTDDPPLESVAEDREETDEGDGETRTRPDDEDPDADEMDAVGGFVDKADANRVTGPENKESAPVLAVTVTPPPPPSTNKTPTNESQTAASQLSLQANSSTGVSKTDTRNSDSSPPSTANLQPPPMPPLPVDLTNPTVPLPPSNSSSITMSSTAALSTVPLSSVSPSGLPSGLLSGLPSGQSSAPPTSTTKRNSAVPSGASAPPASTSGKTDANKSTSIVVAQKPASAVQTSAKVSVTDTKAPVVPTAARPTQVKDNAAVRDAQDSSEYEDDRTIRRHRSNHSSNNDHGGHHSSRNGRTSSSTSARRSHRSSAPSSSNPGAGPSLDHKRPSRKDPPHENGPPTSWMPRIPWPPTTTGTSKTTDMQALTAASDPVLLEDDAEQRWDELDHELSQRGH